MTDQTAHPSPSPSPSPAEKPPIIGDPVPIAFGLFAFALAVYGVRMVSIDASSLAASSTQYALNFAVLAAGIAETTAGFFAIVRKDVFPGWVTATFGIWLIGFYFLLTSEDMSAATTVSPALKGAQKEAAAAALVGGFHANSLAWYALILIIPVGIYAVVAFKEKNIALIIAFVLIEVLLLLLGLAFHSVYNQLNTAATVGTPPDFSSAVNMLKASAYLGFISAAAVWYLQAKDVFTTTGVIKAKA